jgi:hypothetical protein
MADFLLKITALNPYPSEIVKAFETYSDLIARVQKATKAIAGEKIDVMTISYDQAIFLLKVMAGKLFHILEAVSTGYLNLVDERLNAKYVLLLETLNGILAREDIKSIKDALPDIPKHLFDWIEDMDVWWDTGGRSSLLSFVGDVEKAWVLGGEQTFPISGWLVQRLSEIDEVITAHRKEKVAQWKRIEKNIDEKVKNGGLFNQKNGAVDAAEIPKDFILTVNDREIKVNDFLISKPHAVGDNFYFFEYVRSRPAGEEIKRKSLKDLVKESIGNRRFSQILNALGFKGEILRAFFPKRGKDAVVYAGDAIPTEKLRNRGIKIGALIKELELAHAKNSPE